MADTLTYYPTHKFAGALRGRPQPTTYTPIVPTGTVIDLVRVAADQRVGQTMRVVSGHQRFSLCARTDYSVDAAAQAWLLTGVDSTLPSVVNIVGTDIEVSVDWDAANQRRLRLIDEMDRRSLTPDEEYELQTLQRRADRMRSDRLRESDAWLNQALDEAKRWAAELERARTKGP